MLLKERGRVLLMQGQMAEFALKEALKEEEEI